MPDTLKFKRRALPHWLVADRSYFVTINLEGAIPSSVIRQMQADREVHEKQGLDCTDLKRQQFIRIESILDSERDGCWLSNPEVADLVLQNMDWLRKKRGWRIYAAVVISTHVHLLMRSETGRSGYLLDDLADFKRFTGASANRILNRKGSFWAREVFDHWIRDRSKFESALRYILNNPVKAGLVSEWNKWPWHIVDESVSGLMDGR